MNSTERFLKAVDEQGDALFRHAVLRVSSREVALDIVQDTYAKTWEKVSDGLEIHNFRAFLFRVLNNLIIDYYRKKKEHSLDTILEDAPEGMLDDLVVEDEGAWIDRIDGELLLKEVEDMPDMYKQVLLLTYVEGMAPLEISEMIEESQNVVSVRLYRAVNMLKKKVEEKYS